MSVDTEPNSEKYDFSVEAERLVFELDRHYVVGLITLRDFFDNQWASALGKMFARQREITRYDVDVELERLNPKGKWHKENDLRRGR